MSCEGDDIIDYLIVDDTKLMHMLAIPVFRSCGLKNFHSVYGANEALRVMRKQKVGFVVTDWLMPQMTGIELVRVIREDPQLFATPILILTGVCTAEDVMWAMEEGADGYLVKPFSAVNLLKAIGSIEQRKADPVQRKVTEMTRLRLQGKYSEAVQIGKEILERQRDSKTLFMVGQCMAKIKQYPDAVNVLTESARAEKCGKSNNLIGKIHMEQGNQEEGIEHLKLASEQCPDNLNRKVDLAEAYFKSGQTSEAEAVIDSVLKSNPTNLILADLGKLYLEQGEVEKAGNFLEDGVVPTPETVHIFNNYAITLRRGGQYDESAAIYKKCIELVPDSFVLYFNAGMVYIKSRRYMQAKEMFEQALQFNPGYEPAKVFLETVKSKIG